jgi:hypothetical protein
MKVPMNINAERFFALTALLAAPLVAAPACVITDNDDDEATASNPSSTNASDTDATSTMTTTTEPTTSASTTDSTTADTGDTTVDPSAGTDDPTGDTTDTDAGTTGGNELGNCCVPDGSLGCEVPEVQDCVCEADPYCCDESWDESCAGEVNSLGCGTCEFPPTPLDCYCIATCDDAPYDAPFQVCGTDPIDAAAAGLEECESGLGATCTTFACDECECFTAEVPEIDCK